MANKLSQEYYNVLEDLLSVSLEKVKTDLPEQDYNDIEDYIEYGEYGFAWELLWHFVKEKGLLMPHELPLCGEKMGFDVSRPK